jgi:hypothetical protein
VLNLIKMDWRTPPLIYTLILLFLFRYVRGTWKAILVFDILLTVVLVAHYLSKEERWNGRNLFCSLPIDRKRFIYGRFLSTWLQISYIQLIVIVVTLFSILLFPDETLELRGLFHLRNVMIFLGCTSIFLLFTFPIYSKFNGRVSRNVLTTGLLISIIISSILAINFSLTDEEVRMTSFLGRFLIEWAHFMVFLKFDYPTILNYTITIMLLLFINYGNIKISEKLFLRNNIPQ